MAFGMNWNSFDSAAYLSIFQLLRMIGDLSETSEQTAILSGGCTASVSGHVKSQAKLWPHDQGIVVTDPSDLLIGHVSFAPGSFFDRIISFRAPYHDVTVLSWYEASSYLF